MLFSIVVPVYNVEKYLDECMQSILQQTKTINDDCHNNQYFFCHNQIIPFIFINFV